jgi:hypothetical protein
VLLPRLFLRLGRIRIGGGGTARCRDNHRSDIVGRSEDRRERLFFQVQAISQSPQPLAGIAIGFRNESLELMILQVRDDVSFQASVPPAHKEIAELILGLLP